MADTRAPNTESTQPQVYGMLIATFSGAIIAVGLRFGSRRLIKSSIMLDDWLILATLICSVGFNVCIVLLLKSGMGLHIDNITRDHNLIYYDFFLALWVTGIFYSFTLSLVKLAIITFYWRIFRIAGSIRLPIKILGILAIGWFIARIVLTVFHCLPVQGYWDKSVNSTRLVDDKYFFFGTELAHLTIDLAILLLPMPYVYKLQVGLYHKISIFGMFLCGSFVCIATVVQLVICVQLDEHSPDFTWNLARVATWGTVETNLAIITACLPSLRPIYLLITKKASLKPSISNITSIRMHDPFSAWSGTWNRKRRHSSKSNQRNSASDSMHRFVVMQDDSTTGFADTQDVKQPQILETTCQSDGFPWSEMGRSGAGIMVNHEFDIAVAVTIGEHSTSV